MSVPWGCEYSVKFLFCEECAGWAIPGSPIKPAWCRCLRHAVWWQDPNLGILRVHDGDYPDGVVRDRKAWVIGIHNGLLTWSGGYGTSREMVEEILARTPDTYLFKTCHSLVVRFRPGTTSDTAYAPLADKFLGVKK